MAGASAARVSDASAAAGRDRALGAAHRGRGEISGMPMIAHLQLPGV